MKLLSSTL